MSYHVTEHNINEITTKKVVASRKMGERLEVVMHTNSGTITLLLNEEQVDAIQYRDSEPTNSEDQVGEARDFIYSIIKHESPVVESEIEEIVKVALKGGYRFDVSVFAEAFGRSKLGVEDI